METMERKPVTAEALATCEGYGVYGSSTRIGVVSGGLLTGPRRV